MVDSRGRAGKDGVSLLQQLWATLAFAGVLIAVIVGFLGLDWGGPTALGVGAALGLLSFGTAVVVRRKKVDASSEEALAASYRTLFFLSFALVELPYLISFVLTFVLDEKLVVFAALPGFLIGMFLIAPFSSELRRRQREITAQGSHLSLEDALRKMPAR